MSFQSEIWKLRVSKLFATYTTPTTAVVDGQGTLLEGAL